MHGKIRRYSFECKRCHGQLKLESLEFIEIKSVFSTHRRNVIFHFHKTLSLAPPYTHKHEIIPFHNTLITNISITYISLPCLCLISLFISNLSKSHLFTSHICFKFRVQDNIDYKLMHMTCTPSNLDLLYMHKNIRR
jgi:hypothetical protein